MRRFAKGVLATILVIACAVLALKGSVLVLQSGSWSQTGILSNPRVGASAAALPNGRILIAGGDPGNGPTASADSFNTDGTISAAPPMMYARSKHVSVVLQDGRILVAGGVTTGGSATNTAEIFDPIAQSWSSVALGMIEARSGATAAVLQDGRVLVAGGQNGTAISSTLEIFDPVANAFSAAGMMSSPRSQHAMAVLPDGRVLIVGGNNGTAPVASTSICDPVAGTVSAGPALNIARYGHSATTLLNGMVVVIGGNNGNANAAQMDVTPAELFDPTAGTFTTLATNLTTPREGHLAILLPNNNSVLIAGGTSGGTAVASAELFTPQESTQAVWTYGFGPTGAMTTARTGAAGSANQLNVPSTKMQRNGIVAVAGGSDANGNALNTAEAYGYPTVQTDQSDYPPGTTVTINGSGFRAGETVTIQLVESPLIDTHGPYTVQADANGNFSDNSFVTDLHDLNIRFYLTATGQTSGFQALNTFTDATHLSSITIGAQSPNPITSGSSATFNPVTLNSNGGGGCTAGLSVITGSGQTGLPASVVPTFGSSSLTVNNNSQSTTLSISTSASTAPGTYTFTVQAQGTSGCTDTVTTPGTLVVVSPTTLTTTAVTSTYGGTVSLSATLTSGSSGVSGKTISFTLNGISAGTATTNSSGVATLSGVSLTGTLKINAGGYFAGVGASFAGDATYGANSATNSLTVNKLAVTVTAATNTKPYDGTTSAAATPTITPGILVTGDTSNFTEAYSSKNVGTGLTLAPTGTVNDGNSGNNYSYTFVANTTGAITAKALTVSGITASNKPYDGTATATLNTASAALVGVISGDTVTLNTASAVGAFPSKAVGNNLTVTVSGLTISGASAGNYTLTQPTTTANITAKALTVSGITASNKPYDGTATATLNTASAALVGVISGDTVTLNTASAVGAFPSKAVGNNLTVTVSGLTIGGTDAGNYTLTQPTTTANITAKALTVSGITASNKPYDGTATATLNTASAALVGVISGDTVTLNTASAVGAFPSKAVGNNLTVTVSGLTIGGTDAGNYTLTQPTTTANITAKALTVSGITASNKPYDGTATATLNTASAALVGVISGDTVTLNTASAVGAFPSKAVGNNLTVTVSGLTIGGTDAGNYTLTQPTTTANITAKALTVSGITASNKPYDGTATATLNTASAALVGVISGDTVTLNTASAVGAFPSKAVGNNLTVTVSGLTIGGTDAGNYTLTQPTTTANITAKALTVSGITASNKPYDGTATATLNTASAALVGVISGDTVTLNTASAVGAFPSKAVGNNLTVTVSGLTISGASAGNYTLTQPTTTANITAKALTVSGITASNKPYDGTATATLNTASAALVGVISGDTVTLNTASAVGAFPSKAVGNNLTVTVSGLTIGGTDAGSYTLTQPTTTANITAKSLTVTGITANNKSYDGTTAATLNTGSTALVGVVSGDSVALNAASATGTFASANAGTGITVTVSGLTITGTDAGNYTLTQPTTTATINKATLAFNSLSISPSSITYGTPQVTVSGKFNAPAMFSESLTITLNGVPMTSGFSGNSNNFSATFVTSSLPVSGSPYAVTINYPGDANYNSVTDTSLMLTVTQASQTITVTTPAPATAIYNSTFTVAATGGGSGNAVTFSSGGVCTNVGATFTMTSGSGICAVKFDQAGNSNYSAATEVTESVTAHPATQTITVTTPAPGTAGYNANFTVAATASSGLTVSFSSSGVCTNVGATFTMTSGSGTCTVKFDQAGNSNYSAATQVTESVTAQPATQTITITTPAPGTAVYNANFTVAATGGGSGNAVTFASGGVCTNVGATFTMTSGSGTCTVKFDQAGNSNYSAATEVTESVTAQQATAIVRLSNLTQTYTGSPLTPTVSTSPAGLAIILSGAPDTNAGSYTVTATVNDPNYQGSATNTLVISQASASTAISSSENPSNYRDSVSFVATVSSVVGTPTGTVQFVIDGSNSGPAVNLSGGTATSQATTTLKPGQHIISAVYSGDSDFAGSTSAFLIQTVNNPLASIVVTPASPTIFVGATQQFTATGTFTDGTSAILPTGGMWAAGNSLASGVRGPMAAAGNNGTTSLLYFFGGQDGSGPENFVQTYNPATGVWGSGAVMTTPRYQGTAVAAGDGKIYVIGGWSVSLPINVVEAYDPVANTWASKADIGHLSACSVGGAINGKIYVVTGCNAASGNVGLLDVYDPAANAWTSLAPAPNAHGAGAGGVINGKLYVVGGYNSTGSAVTATLDVFDPQANTWTTLASMPTALGELSGGVWGGKLYAVGGANSSNNLQSSVYIYDPVANLWSAGPSLSQGRQDISLATIDGLLYAGGGSTASVSNTNLLEVLDTDTVTWKSDTTSVATVDSNAGLATGVTPGTANISATSALFPAVKGSTLLTVQNAHTTTTVTSSLNPSTYGNAVSFTATVAPQQTGLSSPTGTVQFKIDGSNFGTPVTLTGGSATSDSTSTLTVAGSPHSMEADYIPASGSVYVGSTGNVTQTINPASLTITASSGTMTYGGTVPTITASYSGFVNGDTAASLTTQPTCSTTATSSSPVGSYPSTCSGAADPNYTINYVTGTVTVTQASLTITASSGSMTYGGTVPTITASYSGFVNGDTAASLTTKPTCSTTATSLSPVNGSPYPTTCSGAVDTNYAIGYVPGTITVNPATPTVTVTDPMPTYDGSPHSATATAVGVDGHAGVNGSFSFTYDGSGTAPTNAKSSYAVVATFTSADPNYAGATANGLLTIKQATPVVTVSGGPFTYDGTPHPATLMAIGVNFYTVPGTFVALYTPGGTTAPTNAGTYPVSATFSSADPNYTSAGAVGTIIINQAQPVFSNLSPSQTINFGVASITLSGTISAGPAAPGGESVTITISGSSQPVTINNDGTFSTTFNTHLVPASSAPYPITYNYAGDGNFKLASDSSKTLTVNRAAAQTTLSSSQNPSTLGQATVFTATVTDASSGSAGTPTGIVYFSDGSALIGSGALDGTGHATFATALLSSSMSPHAVTAIYNGDSNFTPSPASGAVSQVVGARSTSTAISASPSTVPVGAPSTVSVKVTDTSITGPSGTPGAFTLTPNGLNTARIGQSAVLLANGMVLLVGGENASSTVLASAELYDPSTGTFATVTNSLNNGRTGATATLLNDGTVLILGGSSDGTAGGALTTAEIYDPVAGTFTTLAHALNTARFGHTATLLPTGKVLIAGGQNGSALNTMEVFDPSGATFTAVVNTLNVARAGATATLLYNGTILFAGGSGLSSAEIYDPNAHTSTATGNLTTDRTNHAAVLLPDGNVLLTGGTSSGNSVNTTELYNTTAGTFIAAGSMQKARNGQSATMLDNAQVLVVGGSNLNDGVLASAELYAPSFDPLGTVSVTSSDSTDNVTLSPCTLQLNGTGATTCSVTDTPTQVGTGTHILTGTYTPASDSVHTSSNGSTSLTVVKADTTTTVTSSANPSTYGQTVTFTATVGVVSPGSGTPSGTVDFKDGSNTLASGVALSGGQATFATSSLNAGPHSITAVYSGDSDFNATGTGASTATPLNQTVNPAMLTVAANPQTKVYGQADPTLTYTVTGFQLGDTAATVLTGALTRASGETVAGSPYAISQGTLTANSNYKIAFTGSTLTITPATLTVTANPQTKIYDQADPALTYMASGFQFSDTAATVLTGTLTRAPGETVAGSPYAISQGTLTANLNYKIAFTGSTLTINPAPLTITASSRMMTYGGTPPMISAMYSGFVAGDTAANLTTQPVCATTATSTSPVSGNPYLSSCSGAADANYMISYVTGIVTVNQATTTTTLIVTPSTINYGQNTTVSATVSPQFSGTPTGSVSVTDGIGNATGDSCTINLSAGTGTCTLTPSAATAPAGATVNGTYSGDTNFQGGSGTASLTVNPAATSTSVSSSKNPSNYGDSVTFTATVTDTTLGDTAVPTGGTVQFVVDGANFESPVTLSAGIATATATSSLRAGQHVVTAVFGGDTDFTGSTSTFLIQTVNNNLSSIAVTPAAHTIVVGQTQPFIATGTFADASSAILPPGGTWAIGNSMQNPVSAPMAASGGNGLLYFFGGQDGSGAENFVQTYNPATGVWGSASNSGFTARYQGVAVASGNGFIYVIGGLSGGAPTATVEAYNPQTDNWTSEANTSHASACSVGGAINGLIYVLTGCDGSMGFSKEFDVYNPTTNTWSSLTSPAQTHNSGAAGVINGKLYVAGGYQSANTPTNVVESYDPQTQKWTTMTQMPMALGQLAGAVSNQKLYIVGGIDGSSNEQSTVYVYDPAQEGSGTPWTTLSSSLSAGRTNIGLATFDGLLYAAGGNASSVTGLLDILDTDNITWASDATSIATVGQSTGLATGVTPGMANISATSTTNLVSGKTQLTVIKADTTTSVASSANPSTYGQVVTFTATVSVNVPGAGTPTGLVNLYDGGVCGAGTMLASGLTLTSGSATFTTSSLSAAGSPHDIIACYSGDTNFNATGTSTSTATSLTQIVNPSVLTVTANPQTKVYGQTDPTLTYTVTGFQLTDMAATVLTGALTRAPGETVVGSPYAISQGTLAANSNYTIHFTGSTLTITPALASVTPHAASKTYGTADPVFTGTLIGFIAADNVTATYARTPGETVGASPYTISATLVPVGVLSNYSITYNTANFAITPASLSITASSGSMIYGGPVLPITPSYNGFANSDSPASLTTQPSCGTTATSLSPVSTYVSACSGAVDINYTISYHAGVVTVTQATTTTAVLSSVNPSTFMQLVTFTATVTPQFSGTTPTGTVTFYNNGSSIGTGALSVSTCGTPPCPDQATFSTASLPDIGPDNITAVYNGDGNFTVSQSSAITQTVQPAPNVSLSPLSVSFGNQNVTTTSKPAIVTLTNIGDAPLSIIAGGISIAPNTDFALTNNCGSSLAATKSCTISITFTPVDTGIRTASLQITDNDDNATNAQQTVSLTGAGLSTITGGSLYTNAIFATANGCGSIVMSGGSTVDSFNSSLGYASSHQLSGGNVGTSGNVTLSGSKSAIYGSAAVGSMTTGNCSKAAVTGVTTNGGAQVTGGLVALNGSTNYPAPPAPNPVPPTTAQNIAGSCGTIPGCTNTGNKTVSLAPGQYGNLSLSGGTTAHVGAGTYNINSLTLSGQSILYVDSGPVVVNLGGASLSGGNAAMDATGGSIQNPSGNPASLQFTYAGSRGINLSGGANSYVTVYAPNALVNMSGGADFFGSIIASTVTNSGGTAVHYDTNLPVITKGKFIWFNAVVNNVNGLPSGGNAAQVKLYLTNSTISFTANGTPYNVSVPNAVVTFNSASLSSGAKTTYDLTTGRWSTAVAKTGLTGNTFVSGLAFPAPVDFPTGIQNVSWSTSYSTDTPGITLQWQWGAAVYNSFGTTYATPAPNANSNVLGVNAEDGTANMNGTDPAGTPETYKPSVIFGATGGGLPNYIGYLTSGAGVVPTVAPISVSPSSLDFGPQNQGTAGGTMTTVLTNNDSASHNISSVSVMGTNASNFIQTNNCPGSLASGSSCTITVTFTPSDVGTRTAKIVVNDDANNSPQTVYLSGAGQ